MWPAKRTALHNYKRQGRLVSEKPVVEQPITHKIVGKKTMTIPRERVLKRAILRTHSEIKKIHFLFYFFCIYPSREQLCSVLLSKRKADVHLVPVGKVFILSW